MTALLPLKAYFLNPACQYNNNFEEDEEVRKGLKVVIKRLEPDVAIQAKALNEVKIFKEARGEFGETLTKQSRTTCLPAEWWYNYGESAPNLRKIAIKVLSQTCSSSGCERNWSTFALIHTKIRNRLAMKKLEQLVYVHYNLRLRVRNLLNKNDDNDYYNPIDLNHIFNDEDILDEWIRESEQPLLSPTDQWLQDGIQEFSGDDEYREDIGTSRRAQETRDSQARRGKGIYVENSEEENSGSGNESTDSGGGGGGEGFSGGGYGYGGSAVGYDEGEEDDGRGGGGGYLESTQVETQTWQKGNDDFIATQDADHGSRRLLEQDFDPLEAQRRYWDQITTYPSQGSDSTDYAYEEVLRRRQRQGGQLVSMGPALDVEMGRMNLEHERSSSPLSSPPLRRSRSRSGATSSGVHRDRDRDHHHHTHHRPSSYYDRDRHPHHGSESYSYGSSSGRGYGYLDRMSSMGQFDGGYNSSGSGTQMHYPPNQPIYPQNSSDYSSQETGAGLSFAFFFGPEGGGEFHHHRHSTYN